MANLNIAIQIAAQDQASGPIGRIKNVLSDLGLTASNVSSGGLSFATAAVTGLAAAAGTAAIEAIRNLIGGVASLGQQALDSYASNERLTMSLESLVAKEIKNSSGIERTIVVGQQKIELNKKEQQELDKLNGSIGEEVFKRDQLSQKLQIAQAELTKMEGAEKRNETAIANKRLAIENLQHSYDGLNGKISDHQARITELTGRQGQYVDVTKKVIEGQLSMGDALAQAAGPARDLRDWIEKLAVVSPLESQGIANTYQLGLNFGFVTNHARQLAIGMDGVKQAQEQNIITNDRITTGLVDWAAAAGKTTFETEMAMRALGQMNITGTIMKQDLNQLTTAGIDWMSILEGMGYNLDDVSNGVVKADDFIKALVETIESDFGGAAARQSSTWSGLLNSLGDIKKIGLREFFSGTFQAIQPYVSRFVDSFTSGSLLDTIRGWGDSLGQFVGGSLANLERGFATLSTVLSLAKEAFDGNAFAADMLAQQFGLAGQIVSRLATGLGDFARDAGTAWTLMSQVFSGQAFSADLLELNFGKVGSALAFIADGARRVVEAFGNNGIGAAIAEFGAVIGEGLGGAWENLIKPKLIAWAGGFWDWLTGPGGATSSAPGVLGGLIDTINGFLTDSWPKIMERLTEWSNRFWDWVLGPGGALERTGEALNRLAGRISTWINSEGQPKLVELGQNISTTLIDGLNLVLQNQEKINQTIGYLVAGLGKSIPSIGGSLGLIGINVASGMIQGVIQKFTGAEVSTQTGNIITDMLKRAVVSLNPLLLFTPVGEDMMKGIKKGIENGLDWIKNAARDAAQAALDAAKAILGIHSPSSVAEQMVGNNFDSGVAKGILGGMDVIQQAMKSALAIPTGTMALAGAGGSAMGLAAPTGGLSIGQVNIYANDEQGGREAARAFVDELRSRGQSPL